MSKTDLTPQLEEVSNAFIVKLQEEHDENFVACVLQACKVRAQIALMHFNGASEQELQDAIHKNSVELATVTSVFGIEAKAVMNAADELYDACHAKAEELSKPEVH